MSESRALLLVGHGSRRLSGGGEILRGHAEDLAQRGPIPDVHVGFLNQDPTIADAITNIIADHLHVVPSFLAAGLITRKRLPEALDAANPGDMKITLHPPVGALPGFAEAVAAHAQSLCKSPDTSLIMVAHGNSRNPASRHQVDEVADRIADMTEFASLTTLFLEERPLLEDWRNRVPAGAPVLVLPYLIGDGYHWAEDVPRMLGDTSGHDLTLARPIGAETLIVDLIIRMLEDERDD